MKRILVIDDDATVIASLKLTFAAEFQGINFDFESDFDTGVTKVASLSPDAVVLDLRKDPLPSNLPGQQAWKAIWDSRFCPVVVYTAGDGDLDPPIPANHPFVKLVIKRQNAEMELVNVLKGFAPCVAAVEALRLELDSVIHQVLRDTAGMGVIDGSNKEHLLHAGRRRIAASMDAPTVTGNRQLMSWELYLIPAVSDSPLTGDLLRKRGANWDDPTAYRLVLTPSCDLVRGRCEPTLLVACCESMTKLAKKLSLSLAQNKLAKEAEKMETNVLTAGAFAGLFPLPAFPSRLPLMVANLKGLEVIPYDAIGRNDGTEPSFDRIASIDSPFREQVAWAYLTTAARPGMPDRDLKPWAEECVKAASLASAVSSTTAPPAS